MARSKDLDERNSTTPISAVPSTILGLDSIPEVDIEQEPEACNRSNRLTFLCKSLSIDDSKSSKMTPEKGNIAATTPESQDHHGFNVDDSLEANPSQANPSKLTLAPYYANAQSRVINSQLRDHNANLQINAATMIQKYARAMITKSNFFDFLLHLFGFKKDANITIENDMRYTQPAQHC